MTSIFCRNAIASPCSAQPKQWKVPWLARTVNEGVFSSWNGQRPFCAPAPARAQRDVLPHDLVDADPVADGGDVAVPDASRHG